MLSVSSQSATLLSAPAPAPLTFTLKSKALPASILQFGSLSESLESFVSLVPKDFQSTGVVKLCCSLPSYDEWCAGTTLDIGDLYELHRRLLVFLKAAVQRLRASKISATYHLSPCQNDSAVALVRAVKPSPTSTCSNVWSNPACVNKDDVHGVLGEDRGKVFLASIGSVPTLLTS